MYLTCCYRPIMAANHTLFWAKFAVAKPIILHETAKIQTTTTGKGIPHLLGTLMEGFEVVPLQHLAHCYAGHTSPNQASESPPNREWPVGPAWTGVWVCGAISMSIHYFRGPHLSHRDVYKGF